MVDTLVTREQFRDDGELAVVHVPTGQHFSTYPYENPDHMSEVILRGAQNETDVAGRQYDPHAISDLAFTLLREKLSARGAR